MTITFEVAGRLASIEATEKVVAGNTYQVALDLDGEWTGTLFMRVRFGGLYYDIPFQSTASTIPVQMPVGYPEVGVGIFSEALEICTNEARIRLLRSILEEGVAIVDFDSDLYDQWTEEITELLCDDHFDATSNRPVQNRVITAWKDTVALDANVVHKTGNESIAGIKTFEGQGIQAQGSNAYVTLKSTRDASAESWKANVLCYDKKDGADSELGRMAITTGNGFNSAMFRVSKPDRSAFYALEMRSYQDYSVTMVAPFYPVDGQGNPTYLTANALIASGNLAVDPRIVRTTGNQTIAGNKTFSGTVNANGPLVVNGDLNTGYIKSSVSSIQQNKWIELARITDMVEGLFYVTFSDPTNYRHEIRGLVWILCRPSQNMAIMRWIAGRCTTPENFAITTDPTNNMGGVWFRKTAVYGTPCLIRLAEHNYLVPRSMVVNGTDTNNYDAIPVPEGGAVVYSTKESWMV